MRPAIVLAVAIVAACSTSSRVPRARFVNAPAVEVVDDRRDVPRPPRSISPTMWLYHFDGSFFRILTRALELPGHPRALGVNSLDEVPDSTWFTNRIGKRDLTLDELRAGNVVKGSPEATKPWTIHSTKVGGESLGFIASDVKGRRFLLKFDRAGFPEMETAAHVIVGKLLWACGFNVTEDHIVALDLDDLVLAPDAKVKGLHGVKRALDRAELERMLATVERDPQGHIRGMASWWLDGKTLGGHPARGVRKDDPNDRIPHERRRDLRGAGAIFAWLDHVDLKQDNSVDVWVTDPEDEQRHYVIHYWIDFGKSLGVMAMTGVDWRRGYQYKVDWGGMLESLLTAGMRPRSWEERARPRLRGVALFDAHFDPAAWKPDTQAYLPFQTADDRDLFWGAKILMRFTREQIRAVVELARLSDPRAAEYITDRLVERQRLVATHHFEQVNPLDRFTISSARELCFDDLLLHHDLSALGPITRYRITGFDERARATGWWSVIRPDARGHACTPPLGLADDGRHGYTIFEVETQRPLFSGRTFVHVARHPVTRAPRVIGIWRP